MSVIWITHGKGTAWPFFSGIEKSQAPSAFRALSRAGWLMALVVTLSLLFFFFGESHPAVSVVRVKAVCINC